MILAKNHLKMAQRCTPIKKRLCQGYLTINIRDENAACNGLRKAYYNLHFQEIKTDGVMPLDHIDLYKFWRAVKQPSSFFFKCNKTPTH